MENLVKTVHVLHSRQALYENLFVGKTSAAYEAYLQMHGAYGIQHYAVNSMLYLQMIKDKHTEILMNSSHNYKYMLKQLEFWLKVIYPFHL